MSACEMRPTSHCVCPPCLSTLKLLTTSPMTTRVRRGSRPGQRPEGWELDLGVAELGRCPSSSGVRLPTLGALGWQEECGLGFGLKTGPSAPSRLCRGPD